MIEFQNVVVSYQPRRRNRDQVTAVGGINLKIEAGEWAFIVGASGAGKSTLLKLVYAGVQATSGSVLVDGQDITRLAHRQIPLLRRKLGVVFQDFQLLPQKSVWENVAFTLQVIGAPQKRLAPDVARALDTVGLAHRVHAQPHELSGGEQQRVAIARAIVNDPLILLADEPTGNLDPETGWEIVQVLRRINERGTTVLMATHDRTIVDALKLRVVRLTGGQMVSDEASGAYHHLESTSAASVSVAPVPEEAEPAESGPPPWQYNMAEPTLPSSSSQAQEQQPESNPVAITAGAPADDAVDDPDVPHRPGPYTHGTNGHGTNGHSANGNGVNGHGAKTPHDEPVPNRLAQEDRIEPYVEKALKNEAPIGSPENPIVQYNRVLK